MLQTNFPFMSGNICFIYFVFPVLGANIFVNVILFLDGPPTFHYTMPFWSFLTHFALNCTWSDMSVVTLTLFNFPFYGISFSYLHFQSLCVFSSEVSFFFCFSCRQHIDGASSSLCLCVSSQ